MTDRYHSLTVVLEADTRDDDCAPLIAAISQLRGVASVHGVVADVESLMAEERARIDLTRKLIDVLHTKAVTR